MKSRLISVKMPPETPVKYYPSLNLPGNAFLKMLVEETEYNSKKKKNGYRFSREITSFAAFSKMTGGKLNFEFLHANLPMALPTDSTVNRFMVDIGPKVLEGVLRITELKKYLEDRHCALAVFISEDATRNVGKVCYNPATNQLIGFVLPLNNNGMPVTNSFPARSAKEIEDHFKNPENTIATMSISVMAQPLNSSISPFCLTIFSTDNKFVANHVINRWMHIKEKLGENDIDAIGFGSDGDSR